jgi:acetyltransferase-like isoleucine patch superfamily enzyme/acyl carrier protein
MPTKECAVEERVIPSSDLLVEVQQTFPDLQAQDAFVVPKWFYRQNLWIEDSWHSENVVYNYPLALRIAGPLDQAILRQSLDEIRRRHDVLRSVFRIMNGRVVQIVLASEPVDLTIVDLTSRGESERDATLSRLMLEEAQRPFDLTRELLLKATLIRLSPNNQVLLLSTHHLVCDDWSTGTLIRELFAVYNWFATGSGERLPELTFSYSDFIRWQEQPQNNGARQSSCKAKLASHKGFYHLRPDFPRAAHQHCNGATVKFFLSKDLEDNLKLLIQRHRVTVFMAMLAGFHCLLHAYSGDADVGVGTCAANRPLPKVESLIGRFANDLVVRADLSGNPNLSEVLVRVRDAVLKGLDYRDLPFGGVLEEMVPDPAPRTTPLFQSMFILQNAPKEKPKAGELSVERIYFDTQMAKYDLTVWLKMEEGIEITFEYNRGLFRQETIKKMAKDYETVLTLMALDQGKRLSDINMASLPAQRSADQPLATTSAKDSSTQPPMLEYPTDDLVPELLMIWREILGIEKIGVNEDFFQLGGDSLRATQLLTRIDNRFGKKLPLGLLLRARTVQEQALAIKQQEAVRNAGKVEREAVPQAPPVVHAGHENAVLSQSRDAVGATTTSKSFIKRGLNRTLHLLCRLLPGATSLRPFLHRMRGVRIGKNVWIGDDVYLENEYPECVEIQDGANIGLRTTIVAHTHGAGKIVIGKNAFVGAGSIIVTAAKRTIVVGEGAVVMASSVVNNSVAPYTLYGPANAKPLAKIRKPFTENTTYEEFIETLSPLES